jgi:hypothetical protein
MNLFITLLENVKKSRTSANNVSLKNIMKSTETHSTNWHNTSMCMKQKYKSHKQTKNTAYNQAEKQNLKYRHMNHTH